MRVQEAEPSVKQRQPVAARRRGGILLGVGLGIVATLLVGGALVAPLVLAKRNDLPLERVYGDMAVSIAARMFGGSASNPLAADRRALAAGREAYAGSCGVCH